MLWFREFFELTDSSDGREIFQLCLRAQTSLSVGEPGATKAPWATDEEDLIQPIEPLPERLNPAALVR